MIRTSKASKTYRTKFPVTIVTSRPSVSIARPSTSTGRRSASTRKYYTSRGSRVATGHARIRKTRDGKTVIIRPRRSGKGSRVVRVPARARTSVDGGGRTYITISKERFLASTSKPRPSRRSGGVPLSHRARTRDHGERTVISISREKLPEAQIRRYSTSRRAPVTSRALPARGTSERRRRPYVTMSTSKYPVGTSKPDYVMRSSSMRPEKRIKSSSVKDKGRSHASVAGFPSKPRESKPQVIKKDKHAKLFSEQKRKKEKEKSVKHPKEVSKEKASNQKSSTRDEGRKLTPEKTPAPKEEGVVTRVSVSRERLPAKPPTGTQKPTAETLKTKVTVSTGKAPHSDTVFASPDGTDKKLPPKKEEPTPAQKYPEPEKKHPEPEKKRKVGTQAGVLPTYDLHLTTREKETQDSEFGKELLRRSSRVGTYLGDLAEETRILRESQRWFVAMFWLILLLSILLVYYLVVSPHIRNYPLARWFPRWRRSEKPQPDLATTALQQIGYTYFENRDDFTLDEALNKKIK